MPLGRLSAARKPSDINMGNPTSYRGYTMTWVKGKQLSTMTNAEQTISFKYDASGMRTKKTVNGVSLQ